MWTYLGQNFLIDTKIRQYIADKISLLYKNLWCEALIEIGPGKWSITKLIHTISPHFFMVDKDPTFYDNWTLNIEHGKFILSDILDLDVQKMFESSTFTSPAAWQELETKKTLVVWNLPYYITSPILRKFFATWTQDFAWWIFMVQDEVGQKIRSDAKKKSFLRWLLNYGCEVTYLKWVPAKCFKPAPKVKSCLIEFRIKNSESRIEWNRFVEFLELFAPFSRKTLWAIQTMIKKKSDIQRHNEKSKFSESFHDVEVLPSGYIKFVIPELLQKKRLEELSWDDLTSILSP